MSLFANLERRRVELGRTAENSARSARLLLVYRTKGNGELRIDSPLDFGLWYVEQPVITTGVSLKSGRLHATQYPNACAGVWRWTKNAKGLYTGAKLFFVVDSGGRDYDLEFSLVFEATAIKMMPGTDEV